jgi:hypothetical protein
MALARAPQAFLERSLVRAARTLSAAVRLGFIRVMQSTSGVRELGSPYIRLCLLQLLEIPKRLASVGRRRGSLGHSQPLPSRRLTHELFLRLWQKGRNNHERDEPLDREACKSRRVSIMLDDQARKGRAE